MRFYKRDPDAALAGMMELSLQLRGAYNSLIDLLYSRDGNVPDDDRMVARMIGCHWREWQVAKQKLIDLGKVRSEGGKLAARRVQEVLTEAADFSQKQRKRAASRWHKSKKINENTEPGMPLAALPPRNANTPTATPTATEIDKSISLQTFDFEAWFDGEFWPAYPRHVGIGQARRAAKAALAKESPEVIVGSVKAFAIAVKDREEKFIPHASTWLNGERWKDERGNATTRDKLFNGPLDWLVTAAARSREDCRAHLEDLADRYGDQRAYDAIRDAMSHFSAGTGADVFKFVSDKANPRKVPQI